MYTVVSQTIQPNNGFGEANVSFVTRQELETILDRFSSLPIRLQVFKRSRRVNTANEFAKHERKPKH